MEIAARSNVFITHVCYEAGVAVAASLFLPYCELRKMADMTGDLVLAESHRVSSDVASRTTRNIGDRHIRVKLQASGNVIWDVNEKIG